MKDKKASSVFGTWFARVTVPSGLFNDFQEWKRSAIRHLCESAFDKGRKYERDSRKEESKKEQELVTEVLRLFNDGEDAEALKELRRHLGLVNRWVCCECGNVTAVMDVSGCKQCHSRNITTKVVQEK